MVRHAGRTTDPRTLRLRVEQANLAAPRAEHDRHSDDVIRGVYDRRVCLNALAEWWEVSTYGLLILATGSAGVPMEDWT